MIEIRCQAGNTLVEWLVGWLVGCLVGWLLGCLVAWLVAWLVGWLVGWLLGWLVGSLQMCIFQFGKKNHSGLVEVEHPEPVDTANIQFY